MIGGASRTWTCQRLEAAIAEGVAFWGYEAEGALIGVMGIQRVGDVDLIRHAYVLPGSQGAASGERCSTIYVV